jgi:hypothetical protein
MDFKLLIQRFRATGTLALTHPALTYGDLLS